MSVSPNLSLRILRRLLSPTKMQNEKFVIRKARTERLHRSAIIHMLRLLNNEDFKNRKNNWEE